MTSRERPEAMMDRFGLDQFTQPRGSIITGPGTIVGILWEALDRWPARPSTDRIRAGGRAMREGLDWFNHDLGEWLEQHADDVAAFLAEAG